MDILDDFPIHPLTRREFLRGLALAGLSLAFADPRRLLAAPPAVMERNELGVTPDAASATDAPWCLITFAQVTDAHVTDTTNPLRARALDALPHTHAAYRPQEYLSLVTWDAVVHAVNENIADKKIHFLISTGDQIDNAMEHETDWFLDIAEGRYPGHHYDRLARKGYMGEILEPQGLHLPWYATVGNHDTMIVGNFPARLVHDLTRHLAHLLDWDFSIDDLEWIIARYARPAWHGLSPLHRDEPNQPPEADGYYAFSPTPEVRCIILNTDNDNWLEGLARDWCDTNARALTAAAPERTPEELDIIFNDFASWVNEQSAASRGAATSRGLTDDLDHLGQGLIGGTCHGTLDQTQFAWLNRELAAHEDRLCLIFSHHGPDSFHSPRGNVDGDELIETLADHPQVVAHLHGHTHKNLIIPRRTGRGGYWDITTCSLAEHPQEWRRISLVDNGDGTGHVCCRMHRHGFLPAREIAAGDDQARHKLQKMTGADTDRDVNLRFALPPAAAERLRTTHTPGETDQADIERIDEPVPEPQYDYVFTPRRHVHRCFLSSVD